MAGINFINQLISSGCIKGKVLACGTMCDKKKTKYMIVEFGRRKHYVLYDYGADLQFSKDIMPNDMVYINKVDDYTAIIEKCE